MARQMTEKERQEFLAEPRIGVVSVAKGDNRPPHTTPVWYAYEPGGNVTFFTGTQGRRSRKAELVERAGVLSLKVQREEFPYGYVTIEGTVEGSTGHRLPSRFSPSSAGTCRRRRPRGSSRRSSGAPQARSCCSRSAPTAG
jgi:hypothetical protein